MARHNVQEEAQKMAETGRLSRDDWLRAALALLAETGEPDGIRIDPLCRRLGVTKGSFYWHFKGRADLIDGLIDYWAGRFHQEIQAELGAVPKDEPLEFLVALSDFWKSGSFVSTDAAMRRWAAMDVRVAAAIESADNFIMDHLVAMFEALGKPATAARRMAFMLIALGVAAPQLTHLQDGGSDGAREQAMRDIQALILQL
ncbi:MAG: TetR/AcrR family transcriptional regulator [Alphaproteobacteria bacterium]